MSRFAKMGALEVFRSRLKFARKSAALAAALKKAQRETPLDTLKRLTVSVGKNGRRFHDDLPDLKHVPGNEHKAVLASLDSYRETLGPAAKHLLSRYVPEDVAFKLVGTGSIGTLDYVILMLGTELQDPLFLQVKQALPSCYVSFLKNALPKMHQGERVATSQKLLQNNGDPLLGWTSIKSNHFVVRQLADHKASAKEKVLKGRELLEYAVVCGEVLSRAHARTGNAAAIWGYCGASNKLDNAIAHFALAYADQNNEDYELFNHARKQGRLD
jgi:uncharacterized protein (DUF2252 family)